MARPKVKIISAGVRRLLAEGGVRDDLTDRGQRVLSEAEANCPVASGALASSLRMDVVEEDRIVVRVGSDLGYAMSVAAGTGFLSRALDAGA